MDKTGALKWFLFGVFSIITAILSMIWTPFDILMYERLRMLPGIFPFEWWYHTPDVVRLHMYIFNITNAEAFLNGTDKKLRLEEVGPIVFREVWKYSDAEFNDNGTLSYTVHRNPVYDPTLNNIDLNSTIIYPNLPVLMTASLFWDTNVFFKMTLNYIFKTMKSKPIVKKTLYEILYNNTDDFLDLGHALLPSIAVAKNCGLLRMMYDGGGDRITMFISSKYGHQRFSLIDNINGSTFIPGQGAKCKDNITDGSDISLYTQFLPKDRIIKYFKKSACRTIPLVYKEEVYRQGVKTYLFTIKEDVFNRTKPAYEDCYRGTPVLLDGLTDISRCWYNYPIVGSLPHFLYGDKQLHNYVDGLKPDVKKHLPYGAIEPVTGISFNSLAMMQANMYIRPLNGFHEMFDKFNNSVIPMFHCSIGNYELPDYIVNFVKFMLLMPIIGTILSSLSLLFGLYCLWKFYNKNTRPGKFFFYTRAERRNQQKMLQTNKVTYSFKDSMDFS